MEYLNNDFAFPGAYRDYTYDGGCSSEQNPPKRCCCYTKNGQQIRTRDQGLMTKDAGTSKFSSKTESLVFGSEKNNLKLGLNFSRSRIETACETDLSLSSSSSEKIEVVDLTFDKARGQLELTTEASSGDSDSQHQNQEQIIQGELKTRSNSFSNGMSGGQGKRKKSLLLQDLESNQRNSRKTSNLNLQNVIFEEEKQMQINSDGDENYLGKRSFSNPVELAEHNGGKMLKMKRTKEGIKVSFTCKMNHRFSLFAHHKGRWCKVCDALLSNAKQHAEKNQGKLLSLELTPELNFQCEQKHQWSVSYKKCLRSWCKVCKKKRKQMVKEILAEEKKRIEAGMKSKQNKMLEEARLNMMKQNSKQEENKESQKKTFKILEEEISRIAKKYAKEFVVKNQESDVVQMTALYKVLILPDKSFGLYFDALSKQELKKEFRRYTILLHPDKNCHPKAKSAFQKIYEIFEVAMKKRAKKMDSDR